MVRLARAGTASCSWVKGGVVATGFPAFWESENGIFVQI
jgi:hypothetical protein